jgi:hypothetical protein
MSPWFYAYEDTHVHIEGVMSALTYPSVLPDGCQVEALVRAQMIARVRISAPTTASREEHQPLHPYREGQRLVLT